VQACPTATLQEKSIIEIGTPERIRSSPPAPIAASAAFKAEMRGDELVRMTPYKHGKANRGHSCVKGRFAYGYASHKDRILNPMIRDAITDPWRKCPGTRRWLCRHRMKGIQEKVRPPFGRGHHLQPLHE
jgi:formate dehydrogenase major subunit